MPTPIDVALITTYELGHQSFGVASAARWLSDAGAVVTVQDLSIHSFDESLIEDAAMVGIYVPMHTATRLAEPVIERIKAAHPAVHICVFGLYAATNEEHLRSLGADSVLSGEFESGLVDVLESVRDRRGGVGRAVPISLERQRFRLPDRSGLPALESYAHLRMPSGDALAVGYTEATRGCKHSCRHCPIVPVYEGRFVVVEPDVVMQDIRQQVDAGARHITFGDPDFLNGPAHSLRVVRRLHEEFPDTTYDVTIKVEHLKEHSDLLSELVATGCVLVTTAVESFDDMILERFDKRHTADDLAAVLESMRTIGLAINPTFVTFTPWTTIESYIEFLQTLAGLGLVENTSPVQYAIRLLVPAGSKLLDLAEVRELVDSFDPNSLSHPWRHSDPAVDRLFETVTQIVTGAETRGDIFGQVWRAAHEAGGSAATPPLPDLDVRPVAAIPYLTEPWYC